MIPIRLKISGFTSYTEREPAEISFEGFDLACISGANGAGKSSLLDAITYALYGKARKQDESIINSASKKAEVTLDFSYENRLYRVVRSITKGKGSQVDFFIDKATPGDENHDWKVLTERTLRETDAKIENTLRLDFDTFINASFFLQGKADSFATQKPSERKRILSSILGLDKWEAYRLSANEMTRKKLADVQSVDARLREIQEELDQEDVRKSRLADLEAQLKLAKAQFAEQLAVVEKQRANQQRLAEQSRNVELLSRSLQKAQATQAETISSLAEKQDHLARLDLELAQAPIIEQDYQAYLTLRDSLAQLDQLAEKFAPIEKERQELLSKLDLHRAALNQDLNYLLNEKDLLDDEVEKGKDLSQKKDAISEQSRELEIQIGRKEKAEMDLQILKQTAADLEAANRSLRVEMKNLKERLDKVEVLEGANCPLCGQPLSSHDRDRLIEELNTEGTRIGDQHRANKKALDANASEQTALVSELDEIRKKERDLQGLRLEYDRLFRQLDQLAAKQAQWEKEKAPRLAGIQTELKSNAFLPDVRLKIAKIETELASLGYDARGHASLRQQEINARPAQDAYQKLALARNTVEQIKNSVGEFEDRLKKQDAEVEALRTEHTEAAARLAAEQAGLPDIRVSEKTLEELKENEAELQGRLGGARQELHALEIQRQRQTSLRAEFEALNAEIRNLRTLERAFGKDGIPAMLIEQDLPELESMSNEILSRLSNYTMSVSFATQRSYKDAKRDDKKETLDILISDGASTRDYETYSGGEAFRVNFAIRLALSRFLSKRAGARLQTLVIDEGFGNQDAQGRQRLIEAINMVRPDFEKILIITHIEELKDAFPTRIEVEKNGQGSRVSVWQS